MPVQDKFEGPIAYNPAGGTDGAGALVPSAEFQVFDVADSSFSTPLAVFDPATGVTINPLRSSAVGVLPDFQVAGARREVLVRSGSFVTRLTSKYGVVFEAGLDPDTVQASITAGAQAEAARVAAVAAKDAAESAAAGVAGVVATNDGIMKAVAENPESAFSIELSRAVGERIAVVTEHPFIQQLKAGDAYIADRLSVAPAYNVPVISTSATSLISGGVLVQATGDYSGDSHFRYNGCVSVTADSTWVSAPSGQLVGNQVLVPEFVTDQADIEVKLKDGRTGDIGFRVIVDGKLTSTWTMLRVAGTANATRYLRLVFPDARVRHIQVESDGILSFGGVIAASGAVVQRPPRGWVNRHVVIGDSLNAGSATYDYVKYESHSRLTAFLLGADFYLNLAVGGTGWIADNSGGGNPFWGRIAVALAALATTLHFYGSRNDVASTVTAVRQAVIDALALTSDVPNVIVGGVAQAGYSSLSDAIRQGVVAAGRTYVDIDALAAANATRPNGHPTMDEQILIGKAVYSQLDRSRLEARAAAFEASRPRPVLTLATSGSPSLSGASVTFTATLSQAMVGVVRFYDGTTLLGSSPVSGATATFTTTALGLGAHSVTARFIPTSPTVQPATSNAVTQSVAAVLGFDDTFTYPDGAVPSPWVVSGAGPVIDSGMLAAPTLSTNRYVIRDAGTLWGRHEFTLAGTYNAALAFQFCHLNSNTNLFVNHNGGWGIWSRISASASRLVLGSTSAWVAGDVIAVTFTPVAGDPNLADVTVEKNGTVVIPTSRVDLTPYGGSTFTGAGFTTATTASKVDRIRMVPAA